MAKVRVFLSFEFDKDQKLRADFYGQANRGDSDHYILDSSLREDYPDDEWLDKPRNLSFFSKIDTCGELLSLPLQRSDMSIVYVRFGVFRSSGAVCNLTKIGYR